MVIALTIVPILSYEMLARKQCYIRMRHVQYYAKDDLQVPTGSNSEVIL